MASNLQLCQVPEVWPVGHRAPPRPKRTDTNGRAYRTQQDVEGDIENFEKVVFSFVILLAATLNFGFVYGDIDVPIHHQMWEFFAAVVINLIATVLKFGDRTQVGAVHLASSLVAMLQLIAASFVWFFAVAGPDGRLQPETVASLVSLSAGALLANVVSVVIMVVETTLQRR